MALQLTDYFSINRGGTPGTAGGATGAYHPVQASDLLKILGAPRVTADLGGVVPTGGTPLMYIDDTSDPDKLMIYDTSAATYVDVLAGVSLPTVVDNLTSTSATDTLSAQQGKILKDLIDGLGDVQAVANNTARDALTGLDAGDIIHVVDRGDGNWERWQVTSVTDGAYGTSTVVTLGNQTNLASLTVISTDANNRITAGGDGGAYLPSASDTVIGAVELATDAEVAAATAGFVPDAAQLNAHMGRFMQNAVAP